MKTYGANNLCDDEGNWKLMPSTVILKSDHDATVAALKLEIEILRRQRNDEHKKQIGVVFESSFKNEEDHMKFYSEKADLEITEAISKLGKG